MLAWVRRLSWKWKLTIVFVITFIFLLGFISSSTGQDVMRDKIVKYFHETPENEQRDSPWADRYLSLAWFRGTIIGDTEGALAMYRNFLGINDDKVWTTWKLDGLCSPNGKTGWGPAHDRAPEAYFRYIDLMFNETTISKQMVSAKCWQYYTLLYDFLRKNSDNHKPHPKFKLYWEKMKTMAKESHFPAPPGIDMNAPDAPNIEPVP